MHHLQNSFLGEGQSHGYTRGFLRGYPNGSLQRYLSPETRVLIMKSERSFLQSGGSNDDNEHTGEDDLF